MRVLITGADGQLGSALRRTAPTHADVNAIDIEDVDFTEAGMLRARLVVEAPQIIINAAACKAADDGVIDEEVVREVNADAVAVLVEAVAETGGKLVHVSCDCVFDGTVGRRHLPGDGPSPQSIYGRTKAQGEGHLRPEDLLVRTSSLYEAGGDNFVRSMIKLMRENDELGVAADAFASPTWATSLARTIWALLDRGANGTFHHTDADEVSHYDFAVAIAEEALALGLIEQMPSINTSTSADNQVGGGRPASALLDCSATRALLGDHLIDWRANLRLMLKEEKALG